jgi:hypothetical protein
VPAAPPVRPPLTAGADQLYVVPAGTTPFVIFTGNIVKEPPLQIVAAISETAGIGFTVTVMVKSVPVQLPAAGVIV